MDPPIQAHRALSDSSSSSRQGHRPIYPPPPPQAIFPAPEVNTEYSSGTSSPSSGSSKRKRSRVSSTSDFNNNTKAQVREQYNNKCWHCGASPADVCHIIGSRDHTFHEALTHGLIDFQEKQSPQNAIALCPTCHTNFDHMYNPSFFFLPTDLEYFINYERQDRRRRRKLGRCTGTIPARMCPTAQTYQDHQIHQGIEGAEVGGLYTRIIVNDFLPRLPGRAPFLPGLSECGATKSWTGSPMASLQRAVLMLRKLNLDGIPRDIRNGLRQLQDAYSDGLDLDASDTDSQGSIELSRPEDFTEGRGEMETFVDVTRETRAALQQSAEEERTTSGTACGNREQHCKGDVGNEDKEVTRASNGEIHSEANIEVVLSNASVHQQDIDCHTSRFWRWGPYATSEDAAQFFQRVYNL